MKCRRPVAPRGLRDFGSRYRAKAKSGRKLPTTVALFLGHRSLASCAAGNTSSIGGTFADNLADSPRTTFQPAKPIPEFGRSSDYLAAITMSELSRRCLPTQHNCLRLFVLSFPACFFLRVGALLSENASRRKRFRLQSG